MWRRPLALAALPFLGIPTAQASAQEADSWSIEESRAPSTTPLRFTATEGTWMSVEVSPDGTKLAFDLLGHIYEMPIEGGDAVALTSGRSWNMFPRYGPDGARVAFTSDRSGSEDLWILHLDSDSVENVSEMSLPVVQATWSADGRALYGSVVQQNASTQAFRFSLLGERQQITAGPTFQTIVHFQEHTGRGQLFFEHVDQPIPASGSRIKTYDLDSGEIEVYRQRPGGAFNPALSPDGRYLVYGHRDDLETVLVLHDLETREERFIARGLDRDHQEYGPYYYGMSPNIAWHPDGDELFVAYGGSIRAIDVATGVQRTIPFRAPVDRELDETIRFRYEIPVGETRALSYRWPHRTSAGVVFEALGDIWIADGGTVRNLTDSDAHETSPVIDTERGIVYYASWTDADLGSLRSRPLSGGPERVVASKPSQYMALTVGPDGTLAYMRGTGELANGMRIESQTAFELIVVSDGEERRVTSVEGSPNGQGRAPLTIRFDPGGEWLYYTEMPSDTLTLRRIGMDGTRKTTLARFPHGERAVLSPDLEWIAFREYHGSFVTPLEWIGKPVSISAYDGSGFTRRVDDADGAYLAWSDAETVSWTRGGTLRERTLSDIWKRGRSPA